MNGTPLQQFLTVAGPIMLTIMIAAWVNSRAINRGFNRMNAAINGIHKRLDEMGVPHIYEEFADDHSSVDYRMDKSLPFLAKALSA